MKLFNLPVLFPNTLLQLSIPLETMVYSIYEFNSMIQTTALELQDNYGRHSRLHELFWSGDDLYVKIECVTEHEEALKDCSAQLLGYVIMNKETGQVQELIIEGFSLVRKKD